MRRIAAVLAAAALTSGMVTSIGAAPATAKPAMGKPCSTAGKFKAIKVPSKGKGFHERFRCVKRDGKLTWKRTDKPGPIPMVGGPARVGSGTADCTTAYWKKEKGNNICSSWFNSAPTFLRLGELDVINPFRAPSYNFTQTHFGGRDDDWVIQRPSGVLGDFTWAFTGATNGYYAQTEATFTASRPEGAVTTFAQGVNSDPGNSNNVARCSTSGQYYACRQESNFGLRINGDYLATVDTYIHNSPLEIVVENSTNYPLQWMDNPLISGQYLDAVGSTNYPSRPSGLTIKPIPVFDTMEDLFRIGTYREVKGQASTTSLRLSFKDQNYDFNKVTHKLVVRIQLSPEIANGKENQPWTWGVESKGTSCKDNPTSANGSSAVAAGCSIEIAGDAKWTDIAQARVIITNRPDDL